MANVTGAAGADTLAGSAGADSIVGFGGADSITANAGNDSVYGGAGNDTVVAGDGNDLVFGDRDLAQTWGYRVYDRDFTSANGQASTIESGTLRGSGLTTGFDVANLALSARGTTGDPNDFGVIFTSTFTATTAGTYRFTTTSDDGSTLRLLDGSGNPLNFANQTGGTLGFLNNDFHQSPTTRFGDVTLAAGQSYTIEIRYWENLGGNTLAATVTPPGGTAVNLANSPFIGSSNATNTGNDQLFGGAGLDTLFGEAGNDTLFGGTENDSLDGGIGNDSLSGDDGNDILRGGDGIDTLDGGIGTDSLFGDAGNDSLTGSGGNDTIDGGSGDDILRGGTENDSLDGGIGNDSLSGDDGNDILRGGDGIDTLDGGIGTDSLFGDAGSDRLVGGDGSDTIDGGSGDDTLTGDAGADRLIGGADRDLFFGGVGDIIDGSETGVDTDTLDLREYGKARTDVLFAGGNNEAGSVNIYDTLGNLTGSLSFSNIETIVPCFTPGTLISTERGDVAVEALRAGDLVMTRDNGLQPVRWIGRRDLDRAALAAAPGLQPVLIGAGALGDGFPHRDMMVSPQHRMLVTGAAADILFGSDEVLISAIHLVGRPGILRPVMQAVSYLHVLCDAHEIILAEGTWTESFQPALRMLDAMTATQRDELRALFPKLFDRGSFPAARRTLRAHEARLLSVA
jgi:serralysin